MKLTKKNKKTIFWALALLILILYTLTLQISPLLNLDETLYSNTAHNIATGNGITNTNSNLIWAGICWVYPVIVGLFFKLFGSSLIIGRLSSLIAGILTLVAAGKIATLSKVSSKTKYLLYLTLATAHMPYLIFRNIRPEAWGIPFTIWGIYFLCQLLFEQNPKPHTPILSALCFSAAVLCHPNFVIIHALSWIYFLQNSIKEKSYKPFISFTLTSALSLSTALIQVILITAKPPIAAIKELLSMDNGRVTTSFSHSFISSITHFTKHYIVDGKRLYALIIETILLIFALKKSQRHSPANLIALLATGYTLLAFTLFDPFYTRAITIAITLLIISSLLTLDKTPKKIILPILSIYISLNILGIAYLWHKDKKLLPHPQLIKIIRTHINPQELTLTNVHFWRVADNHNATLTEEKWRIGNQTNKISLEDYISQKDIKNIILSDMFKTGISGITKTTHKNNHHKFYEHFFDTCTSYAKTHNYKSKIIPTNSYGNILIYTKD